MEKKNPNKRRISPSLSGDGIGPRLKLHSVVTPESQQTFKGTHGCATCLLSGTGGSFVLSTHLPRNAAAPFFHGRDTRPPCNRVIARNETVVRTSARDWDSMHSLLEIVFCESDEPGFQRSITVPRITLATKDWWLASLSGESFKWTRVCWSRGLISMLNGLSRRKLRHTLLTCPIGWFIAFKLRGNRQGKINNSFFF